MILQLFGALALTILSSFNTIAQTFNEVNSIDNTIQQNESDFSIEKEPYKKKVELSTDYLSTLGDTQLVFAAKNYASSGAGVYYTAGSSIVLENSASVGFSGYYSFDAIINVGDSVNEYSIYRLGFGIQAYIQPLPVGGTSISYNLYQVYLREVSSNRDYNMYHAPLSSNGTGTFQKRYSIFSVQSIRSFSGDTTKLFTLCNRFFDIYELGENVFKYKEDFNYNAPYDFASSSPLVEDDNFTTAFSVQIKTFDLPLFLSGGYVFNQIKMYYFNAYGSRFLTREGEMVIQSAEHYGYYNYMEYINTTTGQSIMVNKRVFGVKIDSNGDGQTYITEATQWTYYGYRWLYFITDLSQNDINSLSSFNNLGGSGFAYINTDETSINNVFSLISTAFGAIGGFLSIELFPGISLGLLLFAPLVVGIILAIIWLVKR